MSNDNKSKYKIYIANKESYCSNNSCILIIHILISNLVNLHQI